MTFNNAILPATPAQLFAALAALGIATQTVEHQAVFTVAEAAALYDLVPESIMGWHCKNLFVGNKQGQRWLITLPDTMRADMNAIGKQLGSGRLSFCKGDDMLPVLGVPPGSATPFAFFNASARAVGCVFDASLLKAEKINVHPLVNTASTAIAVTDLIRFLASCGVTPTVINCATNVAA